jgi:hypothetical protein
MEIKRKEEEKNAKIKDKEMKQSILDNVKLNIESELKRKEDEKQRIQREQQEKERKLQSLETER